MKRIIFALVGFIALAGIVVATAPVSGQSGGETAPIYGVKLPQGYRDWHLISVSRLAGGKSDPALVEAHMAHQQLRAQLGNDIAMKAFRERKLPFPDGSIIAALHWNPVSSDENNKVLAVGFPGAGLDSSVPESAVNVQIMTKDSTKYAATGGWGFADFTNGKPGNEALHKACFPCHQPAKAHDLRFHTLRADAMN